MNEILVSNNNTTEFVCVVNIFDLTHIIKYIIDYIFDNTK